MISARRSRMPISAISPASSIARTCGRNACRAASSSALRMRPDWRFLDESTSALDEKLEAELYAVIAKRLPNTTVVSIGHRSTLGAFHRRRLEMTAEGDHFTPRDAAKVAAAE